MNFPAGDTVRTIAVTILDDSDPEAIEEFVVTLSNPQNAALLDGEGTATITDNDGGTGDPDLTPGLPTLSINNVTVNGRWAECDIHRKAERSEH